MVFESAIALADRLLTAKGEVATYRRPVNTAAPDPERPWELGAEDDPIEVSVRAVFLDHATFRELDWTIDEAAQIAFVPGNALPGLTPDVSKDLLVRANGEIWSVNRVSHLSPNGESVLFQFGLVK